MSRLAILICTLPERFEKLEELKHVLEPQLGDRAFISIHDAGRHLPTGSKRNQLIEQTQSEYFCFIDDDDMVPNYYVTEMLKAMDQNPDVITFIGQMTTNGVHPANFTIKLGSDYTERTGHYYRFPNHLCAFKREKVNMIKFKDIWVQEDYIWAKTINDRKLLNTEVHIDIPMYHYRFTDRKPPYARSSDLR